MRLWFLKSLLAILCSISSPLGVFAAGQAPAEDRPVEKVKITTSIPPLAIIAQEIAGEFAEVSVLIKGGASPHDYALTIGQALSLQEADILLWVGPEFEQFLADIKKPRESLSIASVIDEEEAHSAHSKKAIVNDTHEHEKHESHALHEHEHGSSHLWLNSHYVEVLAKALTRQLEDLLPEHVQQFQDALAEFETHYQRAIEENRKVLNGFPQKTFIAHHDGYTQLLPRYKLVQSAALTRVPHERVSAKRLAELEQSLNGASCLLAEMDEVQEAKRYSRILDLPLVEIDILASKANFKRYADFERSLGESLRQCFVKQDFLSDK